MNLTFPNQSKLLLGIFMLLGFFLRFHGIDKFGIAGDEKYSLFVSQFTSYQGDNQKDSVRKPDSNYFTAKEFWTEKGIDGFYDAIARVDTGNGAFFTYSLHWWTRFFGNSDMSLRFIPLLFSLGLIPLLYFFVKEHFKDENLALIVTGFATFSPFLISYAQVARNYAVLFFFALLSTHYFLRLLTQKTRSRKWILYCFLYGITAAICELNHLSTLPLFFIHFLYLMFYHRNWKNFWSFSLAMVLLFVAVVAWLLCPGGAFVFDYIKNSVRVYNELAETSPYEFLSKTSFKNIILQMRHVLGAYLMNFDGIYEQISGKKNGLMGIGFALIGFAMYQFKSINDVIKLVLGLCLTALAIFVIKDGELASISLGLNLIFISIGFYRFFKNKTAHQNPLLTFILLLAVLPLCFLVLYAIQDGNTFRIITRYVGYSFSFSLILVLYIYRELFRVIEEWTPWLYVACALQAILLSVNIGNIYQDLQPRYFSNYAEPRTANPYPIIANKIETMAVKGDTIVHPTDLLIHDDRITHKSVLDAQIVNFYLSKSNEILQRISDTEHNKVFLIKQDGQIIELFDFKGTKYRF
jgi:uncharacterized membrane protein